MYVYIYTVRCSEAMKADMTKEMKMCFIFLLLFEIFFLLFFLLRHCPDLAVCEIFESLFFLSVFLFWPVSLPFFSHSSVKHVVRFVPFAFPWHRTNVKYREKINQWRRTFKPTTHTTFAPTHTHKHTHTHTHAILPVSLYAKVGWIKIQRWTLQHWQWKLQFLQPGLSWLTGDISSPLSPTY